ncbi:MAG: hypothetical protein M3401_04420 [Actinomycetota bacterium]|nr:hypothetical protein [Actinomycetota bacterium]
MTDKPKGIFISLAAVAALAVGGAAIAGAAGNDQQPAAEPVVTSQVAASQDDEAPARDDDATEKPITGSALDKAAHAALAHVGGGDVTDTEVGDEEGYYEVEVTTNTGQVDVHLDKQFNVVSTERDNDQNEDGP